jgi:hypothetical protein
MCHRAIPRYRGVGSEAYLNSTSQGEPVLSLSKEHPRTPGRTDISAVAVTPWRDEISGLSRSVEVGKIFCDVTIDSANFCSWGMSGFDLRTERGDHV